MDIYSRQQQAVGGVFTTDRAVAAIASGGGSWVSALIQNLQSDYAQSYQPLYELGSSNVYRVLGRPEGQMSIQRIVAVGGNNALDATLFNACNTGGTMTVTATSGLCSGQPGRISMVFNGLFVVSYGVQIAVGDQMIRENVRLAFTSFNRIIS